MKFHPITIPPDQAQFLETRKFQISEIARIFRVPPSELLCELLPPQPASWQSGDPGVHTRSHEATPYMLADLERATFSNIEHLSLEFVKFSLEPWVVRWEQALMQTLLLPQESAEVFIKFNLDGLLRGAPAVGSSASPTSYRLA